ncbi:MAG TPA: VOC family protein [Candidatus Binataceae bacterium]|nr:VOC family protein [Candidatus Binataceae bacterium]
MATLKRLDRLDVATADLADAASIYRKNFGFEVVSSADGKTATVRIGDSEIKLAAGDVVQEIIAKAGEGMFALWLEADDVDAVAAVLKKTGIEPGAIRKEQGRRVLAVDPKHANQVPLFIFDRKG